MIPAATRRFVRQRADQRCEYCRIRHNVPLAHSDADSDDL